MEAPSSDSKGKKKRDLLAFHEDLSPLTPIIRNVKLTGTVTWLMTCNERVDTKGQEQLEAGVVIEEGVILTEACVLSSFWWHLAMAESYVVG